MTTGASRGVKQPERPKLLQILGPGLITGAADDDPSGIATYSQVGYQFGYGLTWTLLFSYPLMCAIQEIAARIGRVTGAGIAGNLRKYYPAWLLNSIVALLIVANTINIGCADLGAMWARRAQAAGSAARSCFMSRCSPLPRPCSKSSCAIRATCPCAQMADAVIVSAYVATVFVVHVPWGEVGWSFVAPSLSLKTDYIVAVVAVLGTTISPYLFFWQANEEVEDEEERPEAKPLKGAPQQAPGRTLAHPHRHLHRHGALQSDRAVHHHHDGGDAQRAWRHRHSDLEPGR